MTSSIHVAINNGDLYSGLGENLAENGARICHMRFTSYMPLWRQWCLLFHGQTVKRKAESQKERQRRKLKSHFKISSSQWLADSICMIDSKFKSFDVLILLPRIVCVVTRSKVITRQGSKGIVKACLIRI